MRIENGGAGGRDRPTRDRATGSEFRRATVRSVRSACSFCVLVVECWSLPPSKSKSVTSDRRHKHMSHSDKHARYRTAERSMHPMTRVQCSRRHLSLRQHARRRTYIRRQCKANVEMIRLSPVVLRLVSRGKARERIGRCARWSTCTLVGLRAGRLACSSTCRSVPSLRVGLRVSQLMEGGGPSWLTSASFHRVASMAARPVGGGPTGRLPGATSTFRSARLLSWPRAARPL